MIWGKSYLIFFFEKWIYKNKKPVSRFSRYHEETQSNDLTPEQTQSGTGRTGKPGPKIYKFNFQKKR